MPAPELVDELESFDDFTLLPYDNKTLLAEPDRTIELRVAMDNLGDGAN
jgi:iron transport multicopper oxidase